MFAIEMPALPMRSSSTATLRSSRVMRSALKSVLEKRSSGDQDKETCAISLSRMVANFMEESDLHPRRAQRVAVSQEEADPDVTPANTIRTLKQHVRCTDPREREILEETTKLVMAAKVDQVHDAKVIRVRVRDGHHEYIDVLIDDSFSGDDDGRIIVDLELRSEFDVARCTRYYSSLLNTLPEVFVGRPVRLRCVVSIVAQAAVKSLKRQDFHVPPWRRPDYMLCKWFSPFTRGTGRPPLRAAMKPAASALMFGPRSEERLSIDELENDEDDGDDGSSSMASSEHEEEFNGWQWNSRPPPFVLMERRKAFAGVTAHQLL